MKIKNKKKNRLLRIIALCFVCLAGTAYALYRFTDVFMGIIPVKAETSENSPSSEIPDQSEPETFFTPTPVFTSTPTPKPKIAVYVCGNVASPGVVYVDEGARLSEAIDLAGGFLWSADCDYLNLARQPADGERIWVPSYLDTEGLGFYDRMLGEGSGSANAASSERVYEEDVIININTAPASELEKLPGIGESRARDIIAYRTKVGEFSDISEIRNVSGIGEAMFNKIKDMIRVK